MDGLGGGIAEFTKEHFQNGSEGNGDSNASINKFTGFPPGCVVQQDLFENDRQVSISRKAQTEMLWEILQKMPLYEEWHPISLLIK